jgi:hypothetical protein
MISICIPTYEMHGLGAQFLSESLIKIKDQSFRDFEIVISDQSKDDNVFECCVLHRSDLNIKYIRNTSNIGNSSANINNAILNSNGKYIKILFQDDFLYHDNSLLDIIQGFEKNPQSSWLVTACEHSNDGLNFNRPYFPKYNSEIHLNKNTISSPSVMSFKKESPILFDENLKWLMDVDVYKRLYDEFGDPIIINEINVVNRIWEKQFNNTIPEDIKSWELSYVSSKKYKE